MTDNLADYEALAVRLASDPAEMLARIDELGVRALVHGETDSESPAFATSCALALQPMAMPAAIAGRPCTTECSPSRMTFP